MALAAATLDGNALTAQTPGAAPTLTVTIKGSTTYAQPTPVPIKSAFLMVTPNWQGLNATTPPGGREASGQPLWVTDAVVFFSNQSLDCAEASKASVKDPADFVIAAGRVEAYMPSSGWPNTQIGKMFTESSENHDVTLDRFSVLAQYTSSKARRSSKDGLRGNDGRLVLEQNGNGWVADFMVKVDDLTAQGKVPVTSCGITMRSLDDTPPLLGQQRLQASADRYGM